MPLRARSRLRLVAFAVLALMLAVARAEALHGVHHDATSGVTSSGCATCAALRAPLVAATPPAIGLGPIVASDWCGARVLCDPLGGVAHPAASRGPPAHG